ncbi:MAG: PAS domain S-box protein [bacterium]
MKDQDKTKAQLIDELMELRRRIGELEASKSGDRRAVEEMERTATLIPMIDAMADPVIVFDIEGKCVFANRAYFQMFGLDPKDVIGKPFMEISGIEIQKPEELEKFMPLFSEAVDKGRSEPVELTIVNIYGKEIPVSITGGTIKDAKGNPTHLVVVLHDITERKRTEERQALMAQVLKRLNWRNRTIDTVKDITLIIKEFMGVEAVGIRLREGEDYPYYITNGFPTYFIEAENYLCARDRENEIIRDSEGNPHLECMCGNIICGRTNPNLPFFTDGGSFWTNSTTKLLASTSEGDRLARTRNRCNAEGYESVALIPLRSEDEIVGLLQLNDTLPDQFDLEKIQFLEAIAVSIGIAVKKKQAEEALRESDERLKDFLDNANELIQSVAPDGSLIFVNRAWREILGYSEEELRNLSAFDIIHPDSLAHCRAVFQRVLAGEAISGVEAVFVAKDGGPITVEGNLNCRFEDGKPVATRGIFRDITERKRAKEVLSREMETKTAIAKMAKALLSNASLDDISLLVLEHAKRLTGSVFGYVGYIDPETGYLVSSTMTRDIWDVCKVQDKHVVFKEFKGLFGWTESPS